MALINATITKGFLNVMDKNGLNNEYLSSSKGGQGLSRNNEPSFSKRTDNITTAYISNTDNQNTVNRGVVSNMKP